MCRRVVNDMVDDIDMKRKKSMALVTGRTDSEVDAAHQQRAGLHPQRSRSFKVPTQLCICIAAINCLPFQLITQLLCQCTLHRFAFASAAGLQHVPD